MAPATLQRKEIAHTFLLAVGYAVFFYCFQFFIHRTGLAKAVPSAETLLHWDATWYKAVADKGYEFHEEASTSGFFYLFPALWRWAHLNVWGVCALNVFLFSAGFSLLTGLFKLTATDKLLWLSVPTVYFAFVPYSEALFFFLGCVLLYGIAANRNLLIICSLFLLSLTRATVVLLVPALLALSLLTNDTKRWATSLVRFSWLYLLPALAGLGLFILIQYWETGVWFAYFKQQALNWGHHFNMPTLPFNSLGGNGTVWLSAIAAFVDLVAIGCFLFMAIPWLIKSKKQEDKLLIVSSAYLGAVLLLILFYNPFYGWNGTNPIGIFRYTLMSPFFYVFLYHYVEGRSYKWQHYLLVFLVANVAYLSFGSYLHIQTFLFFNANTLLIFLHMHYGKSKNSFGIIAIAINFFLQVHLFQMFIEGGVFPD